MRQGALALARILALALALASVSGCIRVGAGDDLHLVCEERTASPRKAYDIGFLVAQTRVEGELNDKDRVAMLEAARHHVITPGGRMHSEFSARLYPAPSPDTPDTWLFEAVAAHEGGRMDLYAVTLVDEGETWNARPPVRPPASIAEPAWAAANASEAVRQVLPSGGFPASATWEQELSSCVRLEYRNGTGDRLEVVVNVVQDRVVLVDDA